MIRFVLQKLLNKKWMVAALLIGNVLFFGIAMATPMYTETILQRSLESTLGNYIKEKNTYPMLYQIRTTAFPRDKAYLTERTTQLEEYADRFGLPIRLMVKFQYITEDGTTTDLEREDRKATARISSMSDLKDHITIVQGRMYETEPDEDNVIEAIVPMKSLQDQGMLIGETLTMKSIVYPDESPVKIRIVGAFTSSANDDIYWVASPSSYKTGLFVDQDLFTRLFAREDFEKSISGNWFVFYDYSDMRVSQIDRILEETASSDNLFKKGGWHTTFNSYVNMLTEFKASEQKVRITFLVLEVPVLVILAAFIFMVSRQMLDMEQTEIAVLKSRGVSRKQLILIYLLQSIVLSVVALVIALPFAYLLVRVLSSANAFLQFVRRHNLKVIFSRDSLLYLAAAVLLSVLTMVVPIFRRSRVTIVNHRQRKNRKRSDKPLWQRFFADFILLAVSGYGLFTFYNQREILSERVLSGAALDPMLYISSSLFMLGFGLFLLRILPLLEKLVYRIFREKWSPALYTSYLRVLRTRKSQDFIMIFLFMTLAIGVFDAVAAHTVNRNSDQNIEYLTGADIVMKERWQDNSDAVSQDPSVEFRYFEPSFSKYQDLKGAKSLTKVLNTKDITVSVDGGKVNNVQLLGIHTKEFGETARFDTSLLPEHWFNYLNTLAKTESSVLLSSNFHENYGLNIGDTIFYRDSRNHSARGVIYGFVDYFPTYAPRNYSKGNDGIYRETEQFLIVANLSWIQQNFGVTPYEIWIRTEGSSAFIYDFREENDLVLTKFTDLSSELQESRRGAILQGTNGILTVGFIVALVLCTVGFLIYWILSIRERELQFGIFRAMGMSMREIITMLLNEHLYISLFAILIGVLDGFVTSRLFMPLIQIGYSSADTTVPLSVSASASDMVRLAVIVFLMLAGGMTILSVIIRRMKIAQALKLGED